MRISVFGLGYVGVVAAACLASKGHRVLGVDVQAGKVDAINHGQSPITEPGLDAMVAATKNAGSLAATDDVRTAVAETDVSIVCVGTPSRASGALDLSHVEAVSQRIREALLGLDKECHHIVFRSTMVPGSTRWLSAKYFADLIARDRVRIYLHPEFLREGTSVRDYNEPSLSVVGVAEPDQSTAGIEELLTPQTEVVPFETAELLKYACNSFHATKVVFANEIGRIGKALNVDGARVMDLLCRDRLLNISSTYLRPGNPFGGSCLPKDVSALRVFARDRELPVPLIESLMASNDCQMRHLQELVERRAEREVVILGLAFKASTDDLRGSAMVALASRLSAKGYAIRIYDPWLNPERLFGANQQLASTVLPELDSMLKPSLGAALGDRGIVLAFTKCASADELRNSLKASHHLIDINGWPELRELPCTYEGICW
jgi:GDP-mannose 6-dehydrogenase